MYNTAERDLTIASMYIRSRQHQITYDLVRVQPRDQSAGLPGARPVDDRCRLRGGLLVENGVGADQRELRQAARRQFNRHPAEDVRSLAPAEATAHDRLVLLCVCVKFVILNTKSFIFSTESFICWHKFIDFNANGYHNSLPTDHVTQREAGVSLQQHGQSSVKHAGD